MLIERFLDFIRYEKRYSPHTILAYRGDLGQFQSYLHENYQLEDFTKVNPEMVRSWVVSLIESETSARSVNRKIASLKSFFKFLIRSGEIKENPMSKVVPPKTSSRLPVFVEEQRLRQLFEQAVTSDDFEEVRDRLILEFFYGTGMRLSELIQLRVPDVDIRSGTVKVTGKRNKERYIPFSLKLNGLIRNYLMKREEMAGSDDKGVLFLTSKGKQLYPKAVYRIVNRQLSLVTTISKRSPHVMRHTFATHMLNRGADLNAIKEILGHSSLAATQVYTHNTIDTLKNIYKQAHPRA